MTITISANAFWEVLLETEHTIRPYEPDDPRDIVWQYPPRLGEGQTRFVELREGLILAIGQGRLHDHLIVNVAEREHWLEYGFHLLGSFELRSGYAKRFTTANAGAYSAGQYSFYGSGLAPQEISECLAQQSLLGVVVHMSPALFRSFTGDPSGELPTHLTHLIRPTSYEYYARAGTTTPTMQIVLQQILHCPYWGMTKRIYLESKALELMALLLEQETIIQTGNHRAAPLKPGTLERIHYAREIVLRHLHDPLSLNDLAKQVKLNEYTLKRGFRQVFGTTVFGYLHDYRLEQARQLLDMGQKVTEVAKLVGFADRSYFAAAFRNKFGVNPKKYLMQRRTDR